MLLAEKFKKVTESALDLYFDECFDTVIKEAKKVAFDGGNYVAVYFPIKSEHKKGVDNEILKQLEFKLKENGFRVWLGNSRNCGIELGVSVRW